MHSVAIPVSDQPTHRATKINQNVNQRTPTCSAEPFLCTRRTAGLCTARKPGNCNADRAYVLSCHNQVCCKRHCVWARENSCWMDGRGLKAERLVQAVWQPVWHGEVCGDVPRLLMTPGRSPLKLAQLPHQTAVRFSSRRNTYEKHFFKKKTATVCGVSSDPVTTDVIAFRFLPLLTRLTVGNLDPIDFPKLCKNIPHGQPHRWCGLAVSPVISLGKRQGGNGPSCALVHSRADQTAA
jgi:hypothetical protein